MNIEVPETSEVSKFSPVATEVNPKRWTSLFLILFHFHYHVFVDFQFSTFFSRNLWTATAVHGDDEPFLKSIQ